MNSVDFQIESDFVIAYLASVFASVAPMFVDVLQTQLTILEVATGLQHDINVPLPAFNT